MSQAPPSNDSFYGSQPYGRGPIYVGPGAPSAHYSQGGPGPYAGRQSTSAPAYGGNNPYDESLSYADISIPAPKGKKGPIILLSIALVMVLGALTIFIASVARIANISHTLTHIKSNGEVAADLEGANDYALYSEGDPSCTVTAPNGSDVEVLDARASNTQVDHHTMVATFDSDQDGKHTIDCTTPGSEDVYIGRVLKDGGIVGGDLGVVSTVLLGIVGLPMLIGAIIWLVVRLSYNRKAREAQVAMGGGHPGGQQWQQY